MKKFSKKQWIKFGIAAILYLLFTLWMQNGWLLFGLIVIVDIFLTQYIPWGAWKQSKNPQIRSILSKRSNPAADHQCSIRTFWYQFLRCYWTETKQRISISETDRHVSLWRNDNGISSEHR